MAIYFYSTRGKYGVFSNFSAHGFFLEGYQWKTVEHYFQAQKFINEPLFDVIRLAKTAKEAAILGKNRKYKIRNDWEEVKEKIMLKAVRKKFENDQILKKILLDTGDEMLVENSPHDYYWGCGRDGTGKNRLGHILMEIRNILKLQLC